ncbi:hypothetical protein D039_4505B, partial [Vibrio parahaemolyticus EKP-028]
APATAPRI